MRGLNKVILIGNLGSDPERIETKTGTPMARFSIATQDRMDPDKTDWHRVIAFGRTAEVCLEYLVKGRPVAIEGRVSYSTYEDDDGRRRKSADIIASTVEFLPSSKRKAEASPERASFAEVDVPF